MQPLKCIYRFGWVVYYCQCTSIQCIHVLAGVKVGVVSVSCEISYAHLPSSLTPHYTLLHCLFGIIYQPLLLYQCVYMNMFAVSMTMRFSQPTFMLSG